MPISDKRTAELMGRPYTRILQEHEVAIARLYDSLGSTFPKLASFWRQMAREELQHRNIIQVIEEKLDSGGWKFQLPTFRYKDVGDSIEWINLIREKMASEGITINKAFEIAIVIEKGMLESDFFEVADPSSGEVMKEFTELTKYTERHLGLVEKEAARLKWKVLGNKVYEFSNVLDNWDTCVDPQAKLRAAQSNILEILISLEDHASSLYRTYSQKFPEYSEFWMDMSRDEAQHSAMLRKLHENLEQGHLFQHIGRFKKEDLQAEIQFTKDCEAAVLEGEDVALEDALKNAVGVEKTMAEGEFYNIVESDSKEFRIIAKRLVELTEDHIHELEEALLKHIRK